MAIEKTDKSKYYLFIDECGDHNLAKYDPRFPAFTLCGILVSRQNLMRCKIHENKKERPCDCSFRPGETDP